MINNHKLAIREKPWPDENTLAVDVSRYPSYGRNLRRLRYEAEWEIIAVDCL